MNPLQPANGGSINAFAAKINAAGSALVYSTYLGGSGADYGYGIAVDSAGNAYITGNTNSTNFPTMNALQATYGGGYDDAFVAKISPNGSALLYSTYLGGSGRDEAGGIAVDGAGNAYVTGFTYSANFPVTAGAFQTVCNGGSNCYSLYDAFVSKLNPVGSALVYSTFLGGTNNDAGAGIAVDSAGNAYVTGGTHSTDFPTTPGAFQRPCDAKCGADSTRFVTQLDASGSALGYSTYLGPHSLDAAYGIAVDS